ncbi:hypothetical protein [Thermosipho globiformans]|uniref:hypothetical protein n=1 Tax=Thermosipho globiformans TaxID=380685 RepID=UPI000F8CC3D8|nr:hypothetical protein [Thermosipho globiformans]
MSTKIFITSLGITITNTKWYTFFVHPAQLTEYLSVSLLIKSGVEKTFTTYFSGVALGSFLLLKSIKIFFYLLLFTILILLFFILGVWGLVHAYTPELFPTLLCGTANGITWATVRISNIIASYFTGYLLINIYF